MINREHETGMESAEYTTQPQTRLGAKDILGSRELTTDFLEGVPGDKRLEVVEEMVSAVSRSSASRAELQANEQELFMVDLIQKGADGYRERQLKILQDTELSETERNDRIQDLNQSFQRAQQMRQMVRAQAMEQLLASLMNPYLWTATARETYHSDLGFETATTLVDEERGEYKSHWDPKVHLNQRLAKYFAEDDVHDIRYFLQKFFKQHHEMRRVQHEVEERLHRKIDTNGYDPRAAEMILSDILGKTCALGAYTRVVMGATAISVILEDADYDRVRGEEKACLSGGVHYSGKVLNLSRDNDRTNKTIAHEDEHALNDVLLGIHHHRYDERAEAVKKVIASYDTEKEYREEDVPLLFELIVQKLVEDFLGENFYMTRFADEVLANKLGNKDRSNEQILNSLNDSKLYNYLNLTEENILKVARAVEGSISSLLFGARGSGLIVKLKNQETSFSPQLMEYLSDPRHLDLLEGMVGRYMSKEKVRIGRKRIVEQVDRLTNAKYPPEKIRALLSPHNPLMWETIVSDSLYVHKGLSEEVMGGRTKRAQT